MNVSEICYICKKSSDQMLMLSCIHDPCLDCAAANFTNQVFINKNDPNIYICEVCGLETNLDSSTVEELNSLANAAVRASVNAAGRASVKIPNQARNKNSHKKNPNSSTIHLGSNSHKKSYKNNNTSPYKKNTAMSQPTIYFCKQHPQEQITYYCFNCQINICPECAIHGQHHDHKVKLIKKAISDVKGEYLEIVNDISNSQTMMTKGKDLFLKEIKDVNDRYGREKNYLHKQFQVLRNCLMNKQKQMLKVLERINKDNIKILTKFLQEINSNYQQVTKVKKSIELILRKDEVLIFQEYRNIRQFQFRINEVRKDSEQIGGNITVLDTEFIDVQINRTSQHIMQLREGVKRHTISTQSIITHRESSRLDNQNNFRQSNLGQNTNMRENSRIKDNNSVKDNGSMKESKFSIKESKVSETELQKKIKKYIVQ